MFTSMQTKWARLQSLSSDQVYLLETTNLTKFSYLSGKRSLSAWITSRGQGCSWPRHQHPALLEVYMPPQIAPQISLKWSDYLRCQKQPRMWQLKHSLWSREVCGNWSLLRSYRKGIKVQSKRFGPYMGIFGPLWCTLLPRDDVIQLDSCMAYIKANSWICYLWWKLFPSHCRSWTATHAWRVLLHRITVGMCVCVLNVYSIFDRVNIRGHICVIERTRQASWNCCHGSA